MKLLQIHQRIHLYERVNAADGDPSHQLLGSEAGELGAQVGDRAKLAEIWVIGSQLLAPILPQGGC